MVFFSLRTPAGMQVFKTIQRYGLINSGEMALTEIILVIPSNVWATSTQTEYRRQAAA